MEEKEILEMAGSIRYLSIRELSAKWGMPQARLRKWVKKNYLPHYEIAGRILFIESEIGQYREMAWRRLGRA